MPHDSMSIAEAVSRRELDRIIQESLATRRQEKTSNEKKTKNEPVEIKSRS